MACKLYPPDIRSSWTEQLFHKFIDVLGDAFLGEGLADAVARRDEIFAFLDLHARGDEFGVDGSGGELKEHVSDAEYLAD